MSIKDLIIEYLNELRDVPLRNVDCDVDRVNKIQQELVGLLEIKYVKGKYIK